MSQRFGLCVLILAAKDLTDGSGGLCSGTIVERKGEVE